MELAFGDKSPPSLLAKRIKLIFLSTQNWNLKDWLLEQLAATLVSRRLLRPGISALVPLCALANRTWRGTLASTALLVSCPAGGRGDFSGESFDLSDGELNWESMFWKKYV